MVDILFINTVELYISVLLSLWKTTVDFVIFEHEKDGFLSLRNPCVCP